MNEIISRWGKKSLSQIITLLTGIVLVVFLINKYTIIDIKLDYFDFISIDNTNIIEKNIVLLSLILYGNALFNIINNLIFKQFFYRFIKDGKAIDRMHIISYTINDILDLMSSISGLLLTFILQKSSNIICALTIIIYMGIIARVFNSIFYHFYYKNLSIISKASSNST